METYYVKWQMANGSSVWVRNDTLEHIETIYTFLESRKRLAESKGGKNPMFSFYQLHKETGIAPRAVSEACKLLAYKEDQYVRLTAIAYPTHSGSVITSVKVTLLRYKIKSDEPERITKGKSGKKPRSSKKVKV